MRRWLGTALAVGLAVVVLGVLFSGSLGTMVAAGIFEIFVAVVRFFASLFRLLPYPF